MRGGVWLLHVFALLGLLGIGLNSATANAQEQQSAGGLPCHGYDELADQLGKKYDETPVSMGIQSNGNLLQVFSSVDSGSWTILSIAPSGRTCVLAAGQSWERFSMLPRGPEA